MMGVRALARGGPMSSTLILRVVGALLVAVAIVRFLAGYYALVTAPGHLKQALTDMEPSWWDLLLILLGLACLAYAAWSDRLIAWAKETFGPLSTRDGLREIADVLREKSVASHAPEKIDRRSWIECTDLQIWNDGGEQYVRIRIHNTSPSQGLKGLTATLERSSDDVGTYELGEMLDDAAEYRKLNLPIQLFTQERLKERLDGGDKYARPFDMGPGKLKFLEIFQVTNPIVRRFHVYDARGRCDILVPDGAQFYCEVNGDGVQLSFSVRYETLDSEERRGYAVSLIEGDGNIVATREFYEED
jgi:hypothetical protein